MKKILTFILLLIFPIITYADETTKFSLNEVTASPGNNVTVNLNMDNNQEFGMLTVKVHYDTAKLEYISSGINGLKAMLRGTDKNTEKGIVVAYAINIGGSNLMKDSGKIMTIEFKIKDGVTEDIPLTLEVKDFAVDENNPLKYETSNGVIKIKDNVNTVTNNQKENVANELTSTKINEDEKITWTTTDDDIASVDDDGNVTFKDNGNVTVEGKDSKGNTVYSKDYFVKDKVPKNTRLIKIIAIASAIIIIPIIVIVWRKKCQKRK